MKIVVVDDSEIVRNIVKQALKMYGYYDIIEAPDGVQAMKKIELYHKEIQLYVLDVNMPNMDGITLVENIRKLNKDTPIVMLTTETDKAKMIQAKSLGASGWIVKPFDAERFIKVVNMFLKK